MKVKDWNLVPWSEFIQGVANYKTQNMGWLIDVTTIPKGSSLKEVMELIKMGEFKKLSELGVQYEKLDTKKYDEIKCTCYGVDNAEDCNC